MGECSTQSRGLDLMEKKIPEGRSKTPDTSDHGIDEGSEVSRSEASVEYPHFQILLSQEGNICMSSRRLKASKILVITCM